MLQGQQQIFRLRLTHNHPIGHKSPAVDPGLRKMAFGCGDFAVKQFWNRSIVDGGPPDGQQNHGPPACGDG